MHRTTTSISYQMLKKIANIIIKSTAGKQQTPISISEKQEILYYATTISLSAEYTHTHFTQTHINHLEALPLLRNVPPFIARAASQ